MTYIRQCNDKELEKLREDMWWAYHEILHMRRLLRIENCQCDSEELDSRKHDNECKYRLITIYP